MRQIIITVSLIGSALLPVRAQDTEYYIPKLRELSATELPAEVNYKGEFLNCMSWTDKLGENYLVTSQSAVHEEEWNEAPISSKELYAKHYVRKGNDLSVLWQLYDFLKDGYCGQFTLDYLHKPYINDHDHDGICETWLVYQLGCRSDWGTPPLTMKIIMHTGAKKFAIRGKRDVLFPSPCYLPSYIGSHQTDDNYKTLPADVQAFGMILWNRFRVEELEAVN